jgi:hypothetical protein
MNVLHLTRDFLANAHEPIPGLGLWQTSVMGDFRIALGSERPISVISCIECPEPPGLAALCRFPFEDAPLLPNMGMAWGVAHFGHRALPHGPLVVHCLAGNNRSGLLAGMVLYLGNHGNGRQVVELIQRANPHALCAASGPGGETFRGFLEGLP